MQSTWQRSNNSHQQSTRQVTSSNHQSTEGTAEIVDFARRCIPLVHNQDATPLRGVIDLSHCDGADGRAGLRNDFQNVQIAYTVARWRSWGHRSSNEM